MLSKDGLHLRSVVYVILEHKILKEIGRVCNLELVLREGKNLFEYSPVDSN